MKLGAEETTAHPGPSVISAAEWEKIKPVIHELYLVEGLSLQDVRRKLADHYNFRPS